MAFRPELSPNLKAKLLSFEPFVVETNKLKALENKVKPLSYSKCL